MSGLWHADFGYDQCRQNVAGIGGCAVEVIACGVNVITYTNGETKDQSSIFYQAPINDLLFEDDIFNLFVDYENNKPKYLKNKLTIRKWFDDNLGLGLAKQYQAMIEE